MAWNYRWEERHNMATFFVSRKIAKSFKLQIVCKLFKERSLDTQRFKGFKSKREQIFAKNPHLESESENKSMDRSASTLIPLHCSKGENGGEGDSCLKHC